MPFDYLTNIPLDEAVHDYMEALAAAGMEPQSESVPVAEAVGRITSAAVYAQICAPHYNACAMDGIAVLARDTFYATETTPVTLPHDKYITVDTGDPLPDGMDAVIMIEDIIPEKESDAGSVRLQTPATPWQHIRQIGEDISAGDMILTSHTRISPAAAGAMLAGGVLQTEVFKRPIIGIIPTGDEIVQPTATPKSGDIIEFNSTIFGGMLAEWGAQPLVYPIVPDDLTKIEHALERALGECDAVIINAGSSAGREDYTARAVANVGSVVYHGLAIRPGKPAILGHSGAKPILGVPGYPVSAIIVLEAVFKPVADRLTGGVSLPAPAAQAVLSRALQSSLKYREFVRVRLGNVGGKTVAVPLQRGAGVVSSFVKADGLMDIPQDLEGYEAGSSVNVRLLKPIEEIANTLVATGSHDPLIDEAAELMKRRWPEAGVASSHVGSMGGIFAIKRGEAHIAGIHLLDEASGDYNRPYIHRYFPQGGVRLVECVQRVQGLMVQKGNPKGIGSLADLAKEGMRYINRQKGSGTRILCDYLCKRDSVDTSAIYGYDREEFTHTAVAALIDADSADAGLGIYSAAKIYGLDFIPICTEQYDILVCEESYNLPSVRRFIDILSGAGFRERLTQLGGYELKNPGADLL